MSILFKANPSLLLAHKHASTLFTELAAFSTMWISVRIVNNDNAIKSKIFISFFKLKKKSKILQGVVEVVPFWIYLSQIKQTLDKYTLVVCAYITPSPTPLPPTLGFLP